MMSVFEAAMVIARRDFIASVYSRSFILFLVAPLLVFAAAVLVGQMTEDAQRAAGQPVVALVTDSATAQALEAARSRLSSATTEQSFPVLRRVEPAENVEVQAGRLLADEEAGYSAVLSGTLERPVVTGPARVDESIGRRLALIVEYAVRSEAMATAQVQAPAVRIERVVTDQAAGNLQMIRGAFARTAQALIFGITVLLATLLLSNLAEEKSNKIIEVLAAAVPLDAVFLGKLIAMLGVSVVGLAVWGGMLGIGYLFVQVVQDWMALPKVAPAVGWPLFVLLIVLYYSTNYMLLGALFLGIGGQASNIREIQTLSMPVTLLQVLVFLLAVTTVGRTDGALVWFAYILPFSSPLAMIGYAAESATLWPHLVALAWQALWVVIIIRLSAGLFRKTVLKSGGRASLLGELRSWRA